MTSAEAQPVLPWLQDSDRRPLPGARPTVSGLAVEADPLWRVACAGARQRIDLLRRDTDHGSLFEFDPESEPACALPRPSRRRQLFREARPFVLAGAVRDVLREHRNEIHTGEAARTRLAEPEGLERFVRSRFGRDRGGWTDASPGEFRDPERDLERLTLQRESVRVWAKTARLSNHPEETSLRLRLGHGEEGADDATNDPTGRRGVAQIANRLLPFRKDLLRSPEIASLLESLDDLPLEASLDIVYWNRPNGGARFHHDAHADSGDGQRGVLYLQLAGRTAWVALSLSDLASRVLEFAEVVASGSAPWILEEWIADGALALLEGFTTDRTGLVRELGLPGAGRLANIVDRGPEFTGYLADVGHACILEPGDAILLPNHGRLSTAMHSVFCAGDGPNLALSTALWRARPNGSRSGKRKKAQPR